MPYQFRLVIDEEPQLLIISPFKHETGLSWLIATVVPESDFMAEIEAARRQNIKIGIAAVVLTIVLGLVLAFIGVRAMLAETLESVRRFSRDLRPIYLEDLGFLPALEVLAREADQRETLSVQLTVSGSPRRLPPDLELAAYRIVQEALNNVVQHAAADQAWVEVGFEADGLTLSVRNDGQGFEAPDLPDALARRGHFGLMGIQERALLYGGT